MKIAPIALFGAVASIGIALAQVQPADAAAQSPAKVFDNDATVPAEVTWAKTCSRCHTTGVGPEIRGRDLPADYIKHIVRNGYLAMPAFQHSALNDASLDAIATMVSKSKAPKSASSN